jgi:hypothetical protein
MIWRISEQQIRGRKERRHKHIVGLPRRERRARYFFGRFQNLLLVVTIVAENGSNRC